MRVCLAFLVQLTLTIIVNSDTDSLFSDEDNRQTSADFSNPDSVDSVAPASILSGDDADGFDSAVISGSLYANQENLNSLNANSVVTGESPESLSTNNQSWDWLNSGAPCQSDIDDTQAVGKLRVIRRDDVCRTGSSTAGDRERAKNSDGSSNSEPLKIPDAFTVPGGKSHGLIYPSENEDECRPSLYGPRKTPMCDSGFGDDFMRYSVLGFVALDMIEGCLPCE